MSTDTTHDIAHRLQAAVEALTPSTPHDGYDHFRRRYIENNHVQRLLHCYQAISSSLPSSGPVCILGASPFEGFIASRVFPEHTFTLLGAPDTLVYRTPDEYFVGREDLEQIKGERYAVQRAHFDSGSLPVEKSAFIGAVCLETIEHLKRDPFGFLKAVHQSLTPGAPLFLSTPNLCAAHAIRRALAFESPMFFPAFGPPPVGILHAHEFAPIELVALLHAAGYSVSALETFDHPQTEQFDHDAHYRARSLLPEALLQSLGLAEEAARDDDVLNSLKGAPLRGDYLLVRAEAGGIGLETAPEPLYVSLR